MNLELFFLTIFEKKVIMKILGYVLKGMSLYIFVAIVRFIYNMITNSVPIEIKNNGKATQYFLGQALVILLAGFLSYKLFLFSDKMIKKASKKTSNSSE